MSSLCAAFFDVDHTVLSINSGSAWVRNLRRQGKITWRRTLQSVWWLAQYRMSLLDFDAMSRRVLGDYTGQCTRALAQEVRDWFEREIVDWIAPEARICIDDHRGRGHVLVLLTSATRYLAAPLAERLGIDHILCTELEVEDGRLTGRTVTPVCYGSGKVFWAEQFCGRHGVDLQQSFFYTDSYSDLPMLLTVGRPRVVNPDPRLRRRAATEGWTVHRWGLTT